MMGHGVVLVTVLALGFEAAAQGPESVVSVWTYSNPWCQGEPIATNNLTTTDTCFPGFDRLYYVPSSDSTEGNYTVIDWSPKSLNLTCGQTDTDVNVFDFYNSSDCSGDPTVLRNVSSYTNNLCLRNGTISYRGLCTPWSGSPSTTPIPSSSPSTGSNATTKDCHPHPKYKRNQCEPLISSCADGGLGLKYAGQGCVNANNGNPFYDGGCQCLGYCGYRCRSACEKDSECYWNNDLRACALNGQNLPGQRLTTCPSVTSGSGNSTGSPSGFNETTAAPSLESNGTTLPPSPETNATTLAPTIPGGGGFNVTFSPTASPSASEIGTPTVSPTPPFESQAPSISGITESPSVSDLTETPSVSSTGSPSASEITVSPSGGGFRTPYPAAG